MDTICFTGGGTAGHISPNLALIPYFLDKGYEVHYIGSKTGLENEMVKSPIIFHQISTGKLRRYFDIKNFTDPFRIINGYAQSIRLLKKIKPKIIFSKGGFVSVPVCVAAKHLGIPVILHESDYSTGLANKLCIPYCNVVCTAFESALHSAKGKGVLTGIPIRNELFKGNSAYAKAQLKDFNFEKPTVMFMGGSLGAMAINDALRSGIDEILKAYNIIHICGKGNVDNALNNKQGYMQFEFLSETLADFILISDFVVSRSGATAIFEFLALNKPMLLIPLPAGASRGDQLQNASYFEKQGWARILQQEQLNPSSLLNEMNSLNANLDKIKEAQAKSDLSKSNEKIINIILENMK
ncbi:MAG: undecaprenyldiphospho-muramoylpentapeptide beta-N-acetylglucosaminyltransferase [Clostridia bacterium]|nr:undecaprenyldiphospho-muramoylpentapeptide beta-N-acetylglucosaminyltransferase [Clostridia bacterium]